MDLNQVKLTKTEWNSTEIPISTKEMKIVKMIMDGYDNINIRENDNQSIANFIKMATVPGVHDYIYIHYFDEDMKNIDSELAPKVSDKKIKKADRMKLELNKKNSIENIDYYEKKIIQTLTPLVKCISSDGSKVRTQNMITFHLHYLTLHKLLHYKVLDVNTHVMNFAKSILDKHEHLVSLREIFNNANTILEKNKMVIDNDDISLYIHQREIFRNLRNPLFDDRKKQFDDLTEELKDIQDEDSNEIIDTMKKNYKELRQPTKSNIVLYSAPTGTGKTLTPLALSKGYRILFVCAARHVGLALARNAVSVGTRVAFAFGCETADDIRLHYSAASEYTRNKKSGGIAKVDNSVGDKVEIMICDIKSYTCAMYYMMSFNPIDNLLMYWDEPTIAMDYAEHPLHNMVSEMWKSNLIPNVVLSSATLPHIDELNTGVIANFYEKFEDADPTTLNIQSHDAKKTIPIIDRNGYSVVPHFLRQCEDYDTMQEVATNCCENKTIQRYIDLQECITLSKAALESGYVTTTLSFEKTFTDIDTLTIPRIKEFYLYIIKHIKEGTWGGLLTNLKLMRNQKLQTNKTVDSNGNRLKKSHSIGPGVTSGEKQSSINPPHQGAPLTKMQSVSVPIEKLSHDLPGSYITTKDAETLTDGPTIFIAEDVEKIAKFYLKQSYIPASVLTTILERIDQNNKLSIRIADIEAKLEDEENKNATVFAPVDTGKGKDKNSKKSNSKKIDRDFNAEDNGQFTKKTKLHEELSGLQRSIRSVELSEVFVPNKTAHIERWASNTETNNAFTSNVTEEDVHDIMAIDGVNDIWKLLLLMGIGVFANHNSNSYTEIMKRMASEKRLYLIVASSDYIYGTNYQFCHGYIGKDVVLTQQKMLQALGRIGRHNDQKEYSIRLRENNHGSLLFVKSTSTIEADNMNRLFVTST